MADVPLTHHSSLCVWTAVPDTLLPSCFFSEVEPWLGILWAEVEEAERQRAYIHPRKHTICRCYKFEEVASMGSVCAWSGGGRGRSREEGAGDLEINGIHSEPPHRNLVISWGHREKKNHLYIQILYLA